MIEVPLNLGRYRQTSGVAAVIDEADVDLVLAMKWRLFLGNNKKMYAAHDSGLMHRVILDCPVGIEVDHINGNGLDNRRANLRLATHSQNLANQASHLTRKGKATHSKFKGVTSPFPHRERPWRATISVDRKQHFLGYYEHEEDAARAYDSAARLHFGEFAQTNYSLED